MSKANDLARLLNASGELQAADIEDGVITAAKLASTLDLSGKTMALPAGTTIGNSNSADSAGSTAYFEAGDVNEAPGGVFYKFFVANNDTWTTILTEPAGVGEWAGIIEVTALAKNDINRHAYQLYRFAYNDAFTSMVSSSQNLTISAQVSGDNLQIKAAGGSAQINFCVRVMGSREDQ